LKKCEKIQKKCLTRFFSYVKVEDAILWLDMPA